MERVYNRVDNNRILNRICQNSFYCNSDSIIVTDEKGIIRYENSATRHLFKYSSGELIGKSVETLIPAMYRKSHHQKFNAYTQDPVPRRMSTNTALKAQRKDGSQFFVSISLQSFEEEGRKLFMAFIRDTSEYVEKNESLDKTLDQLNRIMKVSKMGSWELDHRKKELIWTDEVYRIFELDKNSYHPSLESFYDLVHEDDLEFVIQSFGNSLKNRIPYNIVHRYRTPGGGIKYLRERCETIFENGEPVKSLGSVQDVTEVQTQRILLKDYVRNLEIKNKELEEYTYVAAHDLQEPLNTILGVSQLLKDELQESCGASSEADSFLQFIEESSNRLKALIKGVMETARIGKSRNFDKVNLNDTLEEVRNNLKMRIRSAKAQISFEELPIIMASSMEMKLLFQNLLSNALKFQQAGVQPEIKITFNDQGHEWLFCVEDNGIGIDPAYKDKLFKMFRRLHSDEVYEGTGLGLAQCKKIVELHNGEIWVESELGKGSMFYFTISKSLV